MKTFADHVIRFNRQLTYSGEPLPPNIRLMNPFRESDLAREISEVFYRKYYSDTNKRYLILGINPGRFGAGLTGIPFTDPKRLVAECQIAYEGKFTHEPSAVFIYDMIRAYGGPEAFYRKFYIHSMFPLGFVSVDARGKEKNYNYYDSAALIKAVTPAIVDNIRKQISFGTYTDVCFCFGTGKNESFLRKLNAEHGFFREIIGLEHPRFIMQYKSKMKDEYVAKYLAALH